MEIDLRHTQNIFQMLREANIRSPTIDTIIDNLPIPQPEKRVMSILNTGIIPYPKSDYHQDISNYILIPYIIKEHRINYN